MRPPGEPGYDPRRSAVRPGDLLRRAPWRVIGLVAVLAALTALWPILGIRDVLEGARAWIASLEPFAPVVFSGLSAAFMLATGPASVVSVVAGGLFPPAVGVLAVWAAENTAAALAFLISRYVARAEVRERLAQHPRLSRLDEMVAVSGAAAVAFTRLLPVFPYALTSYAWGLTGVRFRTFALWTAVGTLPGTVAYVVGTAALVDALETGRVPAPLAAALALSLAVVVLLYLGARRRIRQGR